MLLPGKPAGLQFYLSAFHGQCCHVFRQALPGSAGRIYVSRFLGVLTFGSPVSHAEIRQVKYARVAKIAMMVGGGWWMGEERVK